VTSGLGWSLTQRGGRLERLAPAECRRLLGSCDIGRLGYSCPDGPRIVPMNYTVVGDRLVFRTQHSTETGRRANGHPVAFEVDQVDEFLHTGWSVLVTGEAHSITLSELRMLDLFQTPDPWPQGERPLFLQLPLVKITGRRVHPA